MIAGELLNIKFLSFGEDKINEVYVEVLRDVDVIINFWLCYFKKTIKICK